MVKQEKKMDKKDLIIYSKTHRPSCLGCEYFEVYICQIEKEARIYKCKKDKIICRFVDGWHWVIYCSYGKNKEEN